MRIVLYQPDIPQNVGSLIRLAACFGLPLDIIEPCGFLWEDRKLRRAGMDYAELAHVVRHESWARFQIDEAPGRLVLLTTKGAVRHTDFVYRPDDILMLGRESAGVPDDVHTAVEARVRVPMAAGARSLNIALAAAVVTAEALRQTGDLPPDPPIGLT